MKVKLWGVRGSLPKPETPAELESRITNVLNQFSQNNHRKDEVKNFIQSFPKGSIGGFGGNTSCYEVYTDKGSIIIDCGSGIKEMALKLMSGPLGRGQGEAHIFLTHFHWDHIIGIPFFTPIFIPGNKIHFYAVQEDLQTIIRAMFKRPFFPVEFSALPSQIVFHQLAGRETIELQDMKITPYQLDHPDPCWGYRVEKDGRVLAHCVDTECNRATREELGKDLPLYSKANLMIFDAQYTLAEVLDKANWGHAVASFGLDLAIREHIERVLFVHHDPYATHEKIFEAEKQTRLYHQLRISEAQKHQLELFNVNWEFAREGMDIQV